jgi:predicted ribosomally synthesized peptide with SipW-like signal peptide
MKKIAMSLATIAMVATMSIGATGAYFSDTKIVSGNTFSTGTVKLGGTYNAPIHVSGLYPGAVKTTDAFGVQYTGTLKGDLYFGFKTQSGGAVMGDELDYRVYKVDANGNYTGWVNENWQHADYPYTNWSKIAAGLSQNEWASYKVEVRMDADAANTLQGSTAYNKFVFYAVQEGGFPVGQPITTP